MIIKLNNKQIWDISFLFIPEKGFIAVPVINNSSVAHKCKEREDNGDLPETKKKQKLHLNDNIYIYI